MTLGMAPSATTSWLTATNNIVLWISLPVVLIAAASLVINRRRDDRRLLAKLEDEDRLRHKDPQKLTAEEAEKLRAYNEDEARTQASTADSSWRTFVLPLFGLTVVFAILAIIGSALASSSTSTHLTTVDLFVELAGAGALIGGIGTMFAAWVSYLDRKRKEKRQADTDTINHVLAHMDRVTPEDIRALAELARALNGDQGKSRKSDQLEIEPPRESTDISTQRYS
jgi:hypothetical protein